MSKVEGDVSSSCVCGGRRNVMADITIVDTGVQVSAFSRHRMPPLVRRASQLTQKPLSGRRYILWLWRYHLSLPSFNVVLRGDHRSLFVLCVTAQWLLGRSAMINSGGPQGRTARIGYLARDLVSSCHKTRRLYGSLGHGALPGPGLRPELATFHTSS